MFETLNNQEAKIKEDIKFHFESFFEGVRDYSNDGYIINPIESISIAKFGIQKINTIIDSSRIKLIIHLTKPGLFIGKGGMLINSLEDYLSKKFNKPTTIEVKEVTIDIWGNNNGMLDKGDMLKLYIKAKEVSQQSYSIYSKFAVGASILTKSGKIYTGTNVENAAYGSTICAERMAIGNCISNGNKEIVAIAIYANNNSAPPCGACRQSLIEFGDNIIVIFKYEGVVIQRKISDLLPYKFSF